MHLRIANFCALSRMMPEPKPTAPFVLRAMHCHADAGVENVTTTIKPPTAAANKSLIIHSSQLKYTRCQFAYLF
jgi:hypothetical protein